MQRYIVIADATTARIFSINDEDAVLELVRHLTHPSSRLHSQEINSDEPGRVQKGMNRTRSAMEPRTDAHIAQVRLFAKEIGNTLQAAYDRHHFDELAIIAPPRFLGLLRKQLEIHSIKCLPVCIARNCTHVAAVDIPKQLGASLADWFEKPAQRKSARGKKARRFRSQRMAPMLDSIK
jgi:protein required for attachment to host cells